MNNELKTRRSFFKLGLSTMAAIPLVTATEALAKVAMTCPAAPSTDPKVLNKLLPVNEKTKKKYAYVLDATSSKHKKYTKGSNCGNCSFYSKKNIGSYSRCSMVGNKYVVNCGWCRLYKVNKKLLKKS